MDAQQPANASSLHDEIMRLPCNVPDGMNINTRLAYKQGHRDARHAAAELAAAQQPAVAAHACAATGVVDHAQQPAEADMAEQRERAAFEAWAQKRLALDVRRCAPPEEAFYASMETMRAWWAWDARSAVARSAGVDTARTQHLGKSLGADPVPATPISRLQPIAFASVVDLQSYAKSLHIGPHLPGVRDVAMFTKDQLYAAVNYERAHGIGTAGTTGESNAD